MLAVVAVGLGIGAGWHAVAKAVQHGLLADAGLASRLAALVFVAAMTAPVAFFLLGLVSVPFAPRSGRPRRRVSSGGAPGGGRKQEQPYR